MTKETETITSAADSTVLGTALEVIADTASGIPAPIRKNAFKAFAQLCTAAVDIPVALLEGVAKEKRAETRARVEIIESGGKKIAEQLDIDPEYARVAVKKYGQKIVRDQVNLDLISENAARELALDPQQLTNEKSEMNNEIGINEDWLNAFEKEACNKSSDEMRLLFGKILAGEIRKPSSYSLKTIKLVAQLDNEAARLFQIFCSLCVFLKTEDEILDVRVVSLGGNAASNALQTYGLGFSALNVLNEYGLIISDYNSYMDYGMCIANESTSVSLPFVHQGKYFGLKPVDDQSIKSGMKLNGVALSNSGRELLEVIDILPEEDYTKALVDFFQTKKLQMTEIGKEL